MDILDTMGVRSLAARVSVERFRHPPPVVSVLRLEGVIGAVGPLRRGMTLAGLEPLIERAFKHARLRAVALVVNSPGGAPTQSDLIATRIRDRAAEAGVPVITFYEDVAASGGYWLACAADEIYARETSIVGSIGVISAGFGFPELLQWIGVERRIYTAGDRKGMLDPFRGENRDDVERLADIQRDMHESFIARVRACRGQRLKGEDSLLYSGEFWTGKRALELGLVDGIGEARQILRARYGEKVVLRRVERARPWWRRRLGMARAGAFVGGGVAPRGAVPSLVDELLAAVEERALWSRFGL